jgi:hypothetical protein
MESAYAFSGVTDMLAETLEVSCDMLENRCLRHTKKMTLILAVISITCLFYRRLHSTEDMTSAVWWCHALSRFE